MLESTFFVVLDDAAYEHMTRHDARARATRHSAMAALEIIKKITVIRAETKEVRGGEHREWDKSWSLWRKTCKMLAHKNRHAMEKVSCKYLASGDVKEKIIALRVLSRIVDDDASLTIMERAHKFAECLHNKESKVRKEALKSLRLTLKCAFEDYCVFRDLVNEIWRPFRAQSKRRLTVLNRYLAGADAEGGVLGECINDIDPDVRNLAVHCLGIAGLNALSAHNFDYVEHLVAFLLSVRGNLDAALKGEVDLLVKDLSAEEARAMEIEEAEDEDDKPLSHARAKSTRTSFGVDIRSHCHASIFGIAEFASTI